MEHLQFSTFAHVGLLQFSTLDVHVCMTCIWRLFAAVINCEGTGSVQDTRKL